MCSPMWRVQGCPRGLITGKGKVRTLMSFSPIRRLLVLTAAFFLLVGFPASAKTTLTLGTWLSPDEFGRLYGNQFAVFTNANPGVDVEVMTIADHGEFAAKIAVLAATGDLPDILQVPPEQVAPIVTVGACEDLEPWITRTGLDRRAWLPGAIEAARFGGITFGMPAYVVNYTYAYNRDILNERGIVPPNADDWITWDQIRDIARKTTLDVDGDGQNEVMGYIQGFAFNYFLPAIFQAGGNFYNDKMLIEVDTPPVYEAINWLLTMTYEDGTHQATGRSGFFTGKIASARFGSWQMPSALAQNTPLGVTSGIQHHEKSDVAYVTTWVMTSGSKNKETVWKLLSALASRESQVHVAARGEVPMRRDVSLPQNTREWHMGFLNSLTTSKPFPYHVQSGYIMSEFDKAMDPVWKREVTAESVLKDWERSMNARLGQK